MAKQILQLGMGDALDDWLIEKIQLLRKGSVVASGIKRVEQVSTKLFNFYYFESLLNLDYTLAYRCPVFKMLGFCS